MSLGGDEMKSKIEELLENDELMEDGIVNFENGLMINDYDDSVDFVIFEYADRFDVYLNLYDEGEAPYRNILVMGSSENKESAMKIAAKKLSEEYEKNVH